MSAKENDISAISNQKSVRIQGQEYKIYSCGTIANLKKASMSSGNILESKELLSKYHIEVLRYSILSDLSQGVKELTDADFLSSEKKLYYFYQTLNNIKNFANENSELNDSIALHGRIIKLDIVDGIKANFLSAINDDFNTSLVISEFIQVFKYANALLDNVNENPLHKLTTLNKIVKNILAVANLLGIFLEEPKDFILEMKEKYIKLNHIDRKEIEELLDLRQDAKYKKNYELSDEIITILDQKGIIVQDSPLGYEWDIKELFI